MTRRELWHDVEADLYEALDVPRDATDDTISTAWHRAARATHPDTGGDAERFRLVHIAYLVLSEPQTRRRYDLSRAMLGAKAQPSARVRSESGAPTSRTPRAGNATTRTPSQPAAAWPTQRTGHGPRVDPPDQSLHRDRRVWLVALAFLAAIVASYLWPLSTVVIGLAVGVFVGVRYLVHWRLRPSRRRG